MPLAIHEVRADGASPEKWLVFLHGILGSGANWRTFARQVTAAKPEWGALLIDLRLHGESTGFAPPHTVASAADDIVAACADKRLAGVLGHSFGGKVALALAAKRTDVEQLFVVDSTPGARTDYRGSSGVRAIVEMLRELPESFADRNAFTQWCVERGVARPTAMWLAMNVRADDHGRFVFRIDVASIRDMMEDYFRVDLWDVIERPRIDSEPVLHTHLIAGGKSEVLDASDQERALRAPRCTVDVIPAAGHWVHVDAPEELKSMVLAYLG
jgi:pimeloyl-ACP methyl ester carboxylesterase